MKTVGDSKALVSLCARERAAEDAESPQLGVGASARAAAGGQASCWCHPPR
jgi:hypothetical protein